MRDAHCIYASMYEMSPETKKAEQLVVDVSNDLGYAIRLREMLRALDQIAVPVFDGKLEVHGLNLIAGTIIESLIMALMRMHDPRSSDRASLPHIFHILETKEVVAEFGRQARSWPGNSDFNERIALEKIGCVQELYDAFNEAEKIERLRKFRDIHIAHTLVGVKEKPTYYSYVYDTLEETIPIVEKLRLALTGHNMNVAEMNEYKIKEAELFWQGVLRGMGE